MEEAALDGNLTSDSGGKLINVDINKEMRKSFLDYSMAVITSRALPDVRDGLKPVHRRILYTMYENKLMPTGAYRKCADTVGAVLGRYHPHGDASVYEAMVRLAQDFSMRYMLVDGHGNFGSVDGDPPAAYRYTESRMSKLSLEMLTNIDEDTVDFMPNYDDRLQEPIVLPSKFPNLLVNGSMGIAVGMTTNIPPHNLSEVIDGIFCLMDNPDASVAELMEHIKGPDFPTSGIIMGKSGIRAAYATGRGKIVVRARTEIVEGKHDKYQIVVTELPYQVNKARLIESIADLVKEKKVEGIADINDYSDREGMRMVIDLKRDVNPQVILNQLFSFTQLQISFGAILMALVNGEPKILTLKEILNHYIDHQCEVITRRTKFRLKKARDRAHIVSGLLKALDIIDEIIAVLKASKSVQEGKAALMEKFDFDDIQATHIVQMRLGQLTGLERQKIEDEMAELNAKIAEYMEILSSHSKVLEIVRTELGEIRDKYGDERRTEIQNVSGEVDIEDLIPEETCLFTLTTMGYIKRQSADTYKIQRRGGKGVMSMTRREEDVAETMFSCSTHDYIMFYTSKGRTYRLKGYEIPEGSRTSKGMNIINLLPIENGEKITAMIRIPQEEDEGKYICMFTRKGIIKRSSLDEYKHIRRTGVIAITLDEDDELAWVKLTSGNDDILVATKKGMSIRFNETDARPIGRTARGVRAINLKDDDEVIGMDVVTDESCILTVSETGYGRRSKGSNYRVQSRGGLGLINYRTSLYGDVAAIRVVEDDQDIILISTDGIIIRIPADSISVFARPGKGVRVMKVKDGEKVVTLTSLAHSEEEAEENPAEEQSENPENDGE
ncbi:MAG: DNA gyrase subunit A [Clostridiales bacterium]|nr:DNA gyrase subunit A [Clostridiales bacterium]